MEITFQPYRDCDFQELATMVFALYTEDPAGETPTPEKIKRTVMEANAHNEKLSIWMFRRGSVIVGYSILNFFWSNEYGGDIVNIDELYVKKEARGQGVASQFIEHLASEYPKGCALKLEASRSNNKAIKFYERLGFTEAPNLHMIRSQNR